MLKNNIILNYNISNLDLRGITSINIYNKMKSFFFYS